MKKHVLLALAMLPCSLFAADQSPYAGDEHRQIKSLSEQEIKSLLRGDGMGFAKLAELNHFPGPKHVLEISEQLDLSSSQLASTQSLYDDMRQDAIILGEKLIAAESRLDEDFQDQTVSAQSLENALNEIGRIRAQLRYVHLATHLRQKQLLTAKQIEQYDAIRGYGDKGHSH